MSSDGAFNDDYLAGSSLSGSSGAETQRYRQRHAQLKSERSTWDPTWHDIARYIQPRHGRFFTSDRNKGDRRDLSIVNNTATRASRIKAAGLMSGLTNPARPWFRYTLPDPELAEFEPVQRWLSLLVDRSLWALQRSNIYLALHSLYQDLDFGSAVMHVEEDSEKLLRAYLYPIGSFCLANSWRQRIDTVYREFQMTAAQLVERFGIKRVSSRTRDAYKNGRVDYWADVLHVVEPNRNLQLGQLNKQGMPYKSAWIELGQEESKQLLADGGYRECPFQAPRWEVNGEDVYGTGSGHDAIGDAKALQLLEKRKAQMIDRLAQPAMQGPTSLRNEPVSLEPNTLLFADAIGPAQAVRPVYEVNPAGVAVLEQSIREHENRINQAFGVDVWAMFANDPQGKMTATEVLQRREEKMLLLGPYLMRLEEELLDPLLDRTASILLRKGVMPPPPPEIQGMELRVEYQSVLAQAQKLVGIQGVRELASFAGTLAQMQLAAGAPAEALDKLDTDQMVDEYAQMLGTRPELVRPDDKVEGLRQGRAQAQAQARALQQAQAGAETAKTLADTNLEGDNVLTRMLPAVAGGRA